MKKLFVLFACLFAASYASASWQDDFKDALFKSGDEGVRAFTRDLGSMTGMMDFRSGTADRVGVGVAVNAVKPSSDNMLRAYEDVNYMAMGYVYADVKIPILGLALGARGTAIDGYESLGGGIKYSIMGESILPFFPDITASFYYDRITFDYFDANHYSASLAASIKVLILEPYIGLGYDKTDLDLKGLGAGIDGTGFTGEGVRYTGGVNLTVLPFVQVFASVSGTKDTYGAQLGVGAKF